MLIIGKPHLKRIINYGGAAIWRCTGPFRTQQFGNTPGEAYQAWVKVMATPGRRYHFSDRRIT